MQYAYKATNDQNQLRSDAKLCLTADQSDWTRVFKKASKYWRKGAIYPWLRRKSQGHKHGGKANQLVQNRTVGLLPLSLLTYEHLTVVNANLDVRVTSLDKADHTNLKLNLRLPHTLWLARRA